MPKARLTWVVGFIAVIAVATLAWRYVFNPAPRPPEDKHDSEALRRQVEQLPLEKKLGQLVIAGFEGYSLSAQTRRLMSDHYVGGFVLYGSNVKDSDQLMTLLNDLKKANADNELPLLLCVDEEGGRVSRMPSEFLKLPSNRVIGRANDADLSFHIGRVISEELAAFGFGMDFAPVLDVDSNPDNPVIGDRSFGPDSQVVSRLGVATMKGIAAGGVIPVVKHFPGHGDTTVDSHVDLPVVTKGLVELKKLELVPFEEAVDQGAAAVMVAHILLPELDPNDPASLSSVVVSDLLRAELDFDGVVVTDDLTMGAITRHYGLGEAAVKAISAGVDIVLVAHGYQQALDVLQALGEAVRSGELPESRITESAYRVLRLKQQYGLSDSPVGSVDVTAINSQLQEVVQDIDQRLSE